MDIEIIVRVEIDALGTPAVEVLRRTKLMKRFLEEGLTEDWVESFQERLDTDRVVHVPGATYHLQYVPSLHRGNISTGKAKKSPSPREAKRGQSSGG